MVVLSPTGPLLSRVASE